MFQIYYSKYGEWHTVHYVEDMVKGEKIKFHADFKVEM